MNQLKALFFFVLSICSLHTAAQRIKGSDTVLPVSQETAEIFMNTHPEQRVTITGGGTGVGISALMDHTTDIAMASRPIKFSEKMKLKAAGQEVKEVIIAYDALAIIVHPDNPVSRLTRQQLEGIFRGKIVNWKQVGGPDMKIIVYQLLNTALAHHYRNIDGFLFGTGLYINVDTLHIGFTHNFHMLGALPLGGSPVGADIKSAGRQFF